MTSSFIWLSWLCRRVTSTRSTIPSPGAVKQSPGPESEGDPPCQQSDDEDCHHASGGEPPIDGAAPSATISPDRLRTPTTYFRPINPPIDGGDRWATPTRSHIIYEDDTSRETQAKPAGGLDGDSEGKMTPNPASEPDPPSDYIHAEGRSDSIGGFNGITYRNTPSVGGIPNSHLRLAMNMNIILIIGIAAGIVILLLILIIAVCKCNGRAVILTNAAYKTDRAVAGTKGYAYEACNTLPPHGTAPLLPAELSTTACASSYPSAPMTVLHAGGCGGGGSSSSAATLPLVKPVKKDVKEWYVWCSWAYVMKIYVMPNTLCWGT